MKILNVRLLIALNVIFGINFNALAYHHPLPTISDGNSIRRTYNFNQTRSSVPELVTLSKHYCELENRIHHLTESTERQAALGREQSVTIRTHTMMRAQQEETLALIQEIQKDKGLTVQEDVDCGVK